MWEILTWTKACCIIDESKSNNLLDSTKNCGLRHTISTVGLQI